MNLQDAASPFQQPTNYYGNCTAHHPPPPASRQAGKQSQRKASSSRAQPQCPLKAA